MKICIIGTGYVGLVTGTCFAEMGNNVICVDNDFRKLESLSKGIIPIYEPGLEDLIKNNTKEGRLKFSEDIDYAIKESLICFIAVGTPELEDGAADLSNVFQVAEKIGKSINNYKIIVNKSTVPVGTAEKVKKIIKANTKHDFDIVSNPEFLKQGAAVEDFLKPDRIVLGTESKKAEKIMLDLYTPFVRNQHPIITMDIKSAEMVKYAANCFLATKISFANEIANICESIGADIHNVRRGMCSDSRIGTQFLYPGLGFGGSCFPKDIKALIKTAKENKTDCSIINATYEVNLKQREKFIKKITSYYGTNLNCIKLAIWGLSFKPNTNDMREAPSITIINKLLELGATITAYDPKAMNNAKQIWGNRISYASNSYEALKDANALLLLTEWNEFRNPDFIKIKKILKTPIIFDGRNLYNKAILNELKFTYFK